MLYTAAHNWLGWPQPGAVFDPDGGGARVYCDFARRKIGGALELAFSGIKVKVGVLIADSKSNSTEAPLAVICEFARPGREEELKLAHALAWNFSRTALLITLEPQRLVAWSCYQDPLLPEPNRKVCELPTGERFKPTGTELQRNVRDLLHWVNLITHRAQHQRPEQFPADGRADTLLLKNLRYVRRQLLSQGLPKDYCHGLLARVIFTQFLFHRKDSDGAAFFSSRMMRRLCDDGTLTRHHTDLASILSNKTDTYSLFRWMDDRFNGDLFPGEDGDDAHAREAAWRAERKVVTKEHLDLLSALIRGDLETTDRQLLLWPFYSFDTIPLEFISSVYEEFLNEERLRDKAYYTPSHLVDYVLDAVLPWDGDDWDLRILDPCCGSGIFLVKAFQRLIYRWQRANKRDPLVSDLRPILANNIMGIDKNEEAVRVASFSLYLAMADAIEPKHYVTREDIRVFPRLRGIQLVAADFFDEEREGFRSVEDGGTFDAVIGNAPWGDKSIMPAKQAGETESEYKRRARVNPGQPQIWAAATQTPVANLDIGPLFLSKAAILVKDTGRVAMIDTASLLYWRDGKAVQLRQHLFTSFTFDEITNLSALRREMFSGVIGPACVVVFSRQPPMPETPLYYFCPKPARRGNKVKPTRQAQYGFTIEPQDISTVTHDEAANNPIVWPVLALGSRRDLNMIQKLSVFPTLAKLEEKGKVVTRLGVIPGDRQKQLPNEFKRRRYFDATQFPEGVLFELDAATIPKWTDPRIDARGSTDFEPFKQPQLLIKQSFSTQLRRFRAALVKARDSEWGVISKKTYLSVRDFSGDARHVRAACVVYNSRFAAYFLALTSSRIGHYITELLSSELLTVPLPMAISNVEIPDSLEAADEVTRALFSLTAADWNLIDDFLDYTLPEALRTASSASREPTTRRTVAGRIEPELIKYAKTFSRVIAGTFGSDNAVTSTIFSERSSKLLPVRTMTIHLDPRRPAISIDKIEADGLLDQLSKFNNEQMTRKVRAGNGGRGLGFQRVAYFFHTSRHSDRRVMNLTIVKPDQRRYWTPSAAMRDSDLLAGGIVKAAANKRN